ncbi:MAG: hypothetical protein ACE366_31145 [Bradymonadia bacterium]
MMHFDQMIQQLSMQNGWPMAHRPDGGYRLELPTEYGRTQIVELTGGQDPDGRPMAFIWSVITTTQYVQDPYYLLRLNADLPYGAIALSDPHVILMETQLLETADHEEVARAIFYVGKFADDLEKQVHGHYDQS